MSTQSFEFGIIELADLGKVIFDSATRLTAQWDIAVTGTSIAKRLELLSGFPIASMTLVENDYEWTLVADLDVPENLQDEYDDCYCVPVADWKTNMRINRIVFPADPLVQQWGVR